MSAATCRSCGAPIVWATSHTSGKPMPIDAIVVDGSGNVRLRHYDALPEPVADVLGADAATAARAAGEDLYTSHFATCPNAAQHRKDRR